MEGVSMARTRTGQIRRYEARIARLQDRISLTRIAIADEGDVPEPFLRFWSCYLWARFRFWLRLLAR